MEVPWSDFIVTPPSFSSSSQTSFFNEYPGILMHPPPDFSSCFPDDQSSDFKSPRPVGPQLSNPSLPDHNEIENRVIIISNVDPSITDGQIRTQFNPFDSIHTVDKSALRSGVLTIEYYDLRHASQIKRNTNNLIIGSAPLQVSYAPLPKIDDPRKPPNNGTIVVFHLPTGVTPQQIESTFGPFGEIRQVRGTPAKPNQRFIEYWDIRAAEKALDALNGQYVMGSKVSIEFSKPGGFRRNVQCPDGTIGSQQSIT
jgi:RNA recognition motif-containing protein